MKISRHVGLIRNLCTLFTASLIGAGVPASATLIGHWTFDEGAGSTAADSSGFNNDATLVGGGSWVTSGAPAGNAYDFPGGSNNYFTTSLGGQLPTGAEERTITLWINPRNTNADIKFLGYGTGSGGSFSFTVEADGIRFRHGGGNITYGGGLIAPNT